MQIGLVAGPIDRSTSRARTIDTNHDSAHRSISRTANDNDRARAPSQSSPGERPEQYCFGGLLVRGRQHEQVGVTSFLDQVTPTIAIYCSQFDDETRVFVTKLAQEP